MNRGNVFKLSGNMALGGNSDYRSQDIQDIKHSLKLLKSKQNQKRAVQAQQYQYQYGYDQPKSQQSYKNNYDFDSLTKNHIPSQKQISRDYGKNYTNDTSSKYKNYGNDYDNYNKPPSYPQQNQPRTNKSTKTVQPQKQYDYPPQKNAKKSYTPSTLNNSKDTSSQRTRAQIPSYQNKAQKKSYQESYKQKKSYQESYKPKKSYQYQQQYNPIEEKSIKEVNRQNQLQIQEYDPSQFKQCRMGCGRMFNPDSLAKHQKNCKKVFQKKRKQFDSQQHRIIANDQKNLMRKGEVIERKIEASKKNQKVPKWKADSLKFRAAMKENRNQQLSANEKQMVEQAAEQSTVKCPVCGRKFNMEAGKRHIKFCEEKAKKEAFKRKK